MSQVTVWETATLLVIGAIGAVALTAWPFLPETMATHWNFSGTADGFSSKTFGAFFIPLLSVMFYFLLRALPKLVPQADLDGRGRVPYHQFVFGISLFFFWIYFLSIWWNLGNTFDFAQLLAPAFGVLFYVMSRLLATVKKNALVGIRSPWTIQDEAVWDTVHAKARAVFLILAVLAGLSILLPQGGFVAVLVMSVLASFGLLIYSAILFYRRHGHL